MKIEEISIQIKTLNIETTVRVLLPEGYDTSGKKYPVLYINDGQDVFRDDQTYWGAQSLRFEQYYRDYHQFLPSVIIAAICSPEDHSLRTQLYSPFTKSFDVPEGKKFEASIQGKGIIYLNWLTTELKPFIDNKYRTLTDGESTAICGYSTGGLNSVYGMFAYPHIFHRGIIISPAVAIWMDCLEKTLKKGPYNHLKRVYMDTGTNEFGRISTKEDFLKGTETIYQYFKNNGLGDDKIKYNVFEDGIHNQRDWRMRFPDAIRWIFPEY